MGLFNSLYYLPLDKATERFQMKGRHDKQMGLLLLSTQNTVFRSVADPIHGSGPVRL